MKSAGSESVGASLVIGAVSVDGVDGVDEPCESSPPQLVKTMSENNAVEANFLVVFFMIVLP
jgi:hypothetical protein